MNTIKIYLHSEKLVQPELIEIEENAPVKEIIVKHHQLTNSGESIDEFEIFVEDDDDVKEKEDSCDKHGIHKHVKVHCHQCKHVQVELIYNGQIRHVKLSPSTTGAKIKSLIPSEFNISEKDVNDLLLETPNKKLINLNDHLGSFVSFPNCKIKISLISKPNVQG